MESVWAWLEKRRSERLGGDIYDRGQVEGVWLKSPRRESTSA